MIQESIIPRTMQLNKLHFFLLLFQYSRTASLFLYTDDSLRTVPMDLSISKVLVFGMLVGESFLKQSFYSGPLLHH